MRARAKCAGCDEPSAEKMATFYWHWRWPSGDERNYIQRMDFECSTAHLRRYVLADEHDDKCVACGVDTVPGPNEVLVWLTMYLPGKDRMDGCLPYHESCLTEGEYAFSQGARRLPSRQMEAGGPPPPPQGERWDAWATMGLKPT